MLIDEIKLILRLSTDAYDDEINSLIESAVIDMQQADINVSADTEDEFLKTAIKTYVKAMFGYNPNREALLNAYDMMCKKLHLLSDYQVQANG